MADACGYWQVGPATATVVRHADGRLFLEALHVPFDLRGQGHATALIEQILAEADEPIHATPFPFDQSLSEAQIERFFDVSPDRERLEAFYDRIGLVVVEISALYG